MTSWSAVAAAIAVTGVAVASFSARAAARDDHRTADEQFRTSAQNVLAAVGMGTERIEALVLDVGATIAKDPHVSPGELTAWFRAMSLARRYPEVLDVEVTAFVRADDLGRYVRGLDDDGVLGTAAAVKPQPPGTRAFYCFVTAKVGPRGITSRPAPDVDVCAAGAATVLALRDSGEPATTGTGDHGVLRTVRIEVPIYDAGDAPATVAGRRAAFAGSIAIDIDPAAFLALAAPHFPQGALTMAYAGAGGGLHFTTRPVATGERTVRQDVSGGWSVAVSAPIDAESVLGDVRSRLLLLGGIVVSVLVGLLVHVLGTGRARALRVVAERTRELRHLALHDALTGLPNRALIVDRVEQALARSRRHGGPVALLFLDIDGFKGINDTYGHAVGDHLLVETSRRLTSALRDSDTVGRLGGDEFVVLVEGAALDDGAGAVAERLRDALSTPFAVDGHDGLSVRASIGIADGPRPSANEMLRDADVALYEAKSAGKDRHVVFVTAMQAAVQERLELEMDLRGAIGTDQLALVYQPLFDLDSGAVTGVEALLRWHHPVRGTVGPNEFIPLAEETSLVVPIGRWVLAEACAYAACRQRAGRPLPVSVNVSGRQLDDDAGFVADVRNVLADTGLDPRSLTLEITETMLMRDPEATALRLRELKALGVRLAIDDFGTGYSSLSYLRRFPVDVLKIDRTFVRDVASSREAGALIRTFVHLGKALGLETLAEGIEEPSQLARLRRAHCDRGQGFLFARPLTPEALEALLDAPGTERATA